MKNTKKVFVITGVIIVTIVAIVSVIVSFNRHNGKEEAQSNEQSQSAMSGESQSIDSSIDFKAAPKTPSSIVIDNKGISLKPVEDVSQQGTVQVILDYTCSYCAQFEMLFTDMFDSETQQGRVTYETIPVSILSGEQIGTEAYLNSAPTKSAVLAYYIAQNSPENFFDFSYGMASVYTELGSNYTDEFAKYVLTETGVSDDIADAAINASNDPSWQTYVADMTTYVTSNEKLDFQGTPHISVEGKQLPETVMWVDNPESFAKFLSEKGLVKYE